MNFRFVIALVAIVWATSIRAEDWPRYHGPDNNGISKETGLLKSWPAGGPKILWKMPLGTGYSSISVAKGHVYTMFQDKEKQYVIAFDEKTGEQLWKTPTGPIFLAGDKHDGPRCTPTVDGKFVYAFDANGVLVCLKASDGKVVWSKNVLQMAGAKNIRWGMAQSPFILGDMLLLNPGGNQGMAIVAFNKKDGSIIWKSGNGQAGYSTPVLARIGGVEQLVFVTGRELVGVAPKDGKVLWSFPWVNNSGVNAASPIVMDDMVFVSSNYRRGAAVVKIDLSREPHVTTLWDNQNLMCHFATPILMDGLLYGYKMGDLSCVDFKTGQVKWSDNQDMPEKGQLTYAEGLYYVLGQGGDMALAQMTPSGFKKISSMDISLGRDRWAPLAIANGRLYMRDEMRIYCLDIKAK